MSILKDLWTEKSNEPETKTTYQYVLDLRERIERTCRMAQKELVETQMKHKKYFDKIAKLRVLVNGDCAGIVAKQHQTSCYFSGKDQQ